MALLRQKIMSKSSYLRVSNFSQILLPYGPSVNVLFTTIEFFNIFGPQNFSWFRSYEIAHINWFDCLSCSMIVTCHGIFFLNNVTKLLEPGKVLIVIWALFSKIKTKLDFCFASTSRTNVWSSATPMIMHQGNPFTMNKLI